MRSRAQAVPCHPDSPRSILASLAFKRCASDFKPAVMRRSPAMSLRGIVAIKTSYDSWCESAYSAWLCIRAGRHLFPPRGAAWLEWLG